jgi:hypothetical protein
MPVFRANLPDKARNDANHDQITKNNHRISLTVDKTGVKLSGMRLEKLPRKTAPA